MKEYFNILSKDLQNKSSLIKEYFSIHAGENGKNKESLIVNFLQAYLPKRYSIGTGFVFDADKSLSNQNDIIIYDSFWSGILFPENVSQFFPIESIYGVIEVKSHLNINELKNTIQKASKVKKMTFKGVSRSDSYGIEEPLFSIFAYDSIDLKKLKQNLENLYKDTPLKERIDFIVVLNKGLLYTGRYFEIATYGTPKSSYRNSLGEEGIKEIKNKNPHEVKGMILNENTLLVWYLYLMSYLSLSSNKVSSWLDYLEKDDNKWGEFI